MNIETLNEHIGTAIDSGEHLARGEAIVDENGVHTGGYETRVDSETGEIFFPDEVPLGLCLVRWKAPSSIPQAVLPQRRATGGIVWSLTMEPENAETGVWYTSVDLNNAIRCGYSDIEILDGFFWDQFRAPALNYIYQVFAMKQEGEASGNKSMRQIAKLLMNALYGKFGQSVHREETGFCYSTEDCTKFLRTRRWTGVYNVNSECVVMEGIPLQAETEETFEKPTWVAPFILGYSRVRMMNAYLVSNPYFLNDGDEESCKKALRCAQTKGDTDSLEIPAAGYERLKRYGLTHACLGGLTNDLGEGVRVIKCENVVPKVYRTWYVNAECDKLEVKVKGAGFSAEDLEDEQWCTMRGVPRSTFIGCQDSGELVLDGDMEWRAAPSKTATGWFRRTTAGAPFPNFKNVVYKMQSTHEKAGLRPFTSLDTTPGKFVVTTTYDRRTRVSSEHEMEGFWTPYGHQLGEEIVYGKRKHDAMDSYGEEAPSRSSKRTKR